MKKRKQNTGHDLSDRGLTILPALFIGLEYWHIFSKKKVIQTTGYKYLQLISSLGKNNMMSMLHKFR